MAGAGNWKVWKMSRLSPGFHEFQLLPEARRTGQRPSVLHTLNRGCAPALVLEWAHRRNPH